MAYLLGWVSSPDLYDRQKAITQGEIQQSNYKTGSIVRSESEKMDQEKMSGRVDQGFQAVLRDQIQASAEIQASPDITPAADASSSPSLSSLSERYVEYTVRSGDTLWKLARQKYQVSVEDLMKDNQIEDPTRLQVGQKIKIRITDKPEETQRVVASWYGEPYHGRPMANGEIYNMYAETIAHRDLPLGTMVELSNPQTGQKVTAKVTDRGPFIAGRDVDLSFNLAQKLSLVKKGVGPLLMRVVG
jgi:rare lipoprotein A